MNKKMFVAFVFLFAFWIAISGSANLQHIVVGIVLSSFTIWFWKDFEARLPNLFTLVEALLFLRCIVMLIGYVVKSNISVIKILLTPDIKSVSLFMELEPRMKTDWGRIFLATCITITPGTITVDIDPEKNVFTIHALTRETAVDLYYWRIITEIKKLERQVQRRKTNVVDNARVHDSNSLGISKSNNGTDRN